MTSGTATQTSSALEFAPLLTAVPCARLHAVHVLREWGLRALAGDAEMIVSELITNAIEASAVLSERPPVSLQLLLTRKSLVIEVWDHSPLDLEPARQTPTRNAGAG
jgi:anti-sigma regulatory factor (Ser/Thr protein kinase)